MSLLDVAGKVGAKTGIPTRERDVKRILAAVSTSRNFWEIVRQSDEPLPMVAAALEVMADMGLVEIKDGIYLSEKGKAFAEEVKAFPKGAHLCPACRGRTVVLDHLYDSYRRFVELQRSRPSPLRQFDQAYVTPEVVFCRVALADSRGDLRGSRVVVLGDDDLTGLALALSGLPDEVVVLDIDERIVDFTNEVASGEGLRLRAFRHDLREPLPSSLVGAFDVFFTDPSETLAAVDAFLGRGILTLKGPGSSGYFGITNVETSFSKRRKIQQVLIDKGLVITDVIYEFNEYVNWDYAEEMEAYQLAPVKERPIRNWYRSSIYRVELVEEPRRDNPDLRGLDIYNDEESSTV